MNQVELGKKIQELRKHSGLTQEDLAEKTGISVRTIQRIENGEVDPRTYTLNKLAEALHVKLEELLEKNEPTEKLKVDNRKWYALFHLSGIFIFVIPCFLVWILKKDKIQGLNAHAKDVFNFQLSMFIYLVCSGLLVIFLIGFPMVLFFSIYSTIIILINTLKVAQGLDYKYPLSMNLIKQL